MKFIWTVWASWVVIKYWMSVVSVADRGLSISVIKLAHPIDHDGQTIDTLTLRAPRVRDMLAADKATGSEMDKEIQMFAHLTEQEPAFIEALFLSDYQGLQRAYQAFLS